jgi:phospholipase C
MSSRTLALGALIFVLSGCNASTTAVVPAAGVPTRFVPLAPAASHRLLRSKIKHVVIIIQENRSLNNLFYGFPGARTSKYGYDSKGKKVELNPISLSTTWDVEHDPFGFFAACHGTGSIPGTDCRMNGFNNEYVGCGASSTPCPYPEPQYAYVPHSETKPYFEMGEQYVLADQMYASDFDATSFISHQYIIAAQAEHAVPPSSGAESCGGGGGDMIEMVGPQRQIPDGYESVCFDDESIGQEADRAGVTWAYYTSSYGGYPGTWNAYAANKYVYYGPDWKHDIVTPQTRFFSDVSKGRLRQISWVTPTCANSDHAGCNSSTGPQWVASLVNAIGKSKYWDSTAIFILWDEYGGWYDPEPPAYVDYDGLGMRVPLLVISAYAKQGYVSHVHYEHGSILKFTEDVFGLRRLSASDRRAASPEKDCFDFAKGPRAFQPIHRTLGKEYFIQQPFDPRPPDDE